MKLLDLEMVRERVIRAMIGGSCARVGKNIGSEMRKLASGARLLQDTLALLRMPSLLSKIVAGGVQVSMFVHKILCLCFGHLNDL